MEKLEEKILLPRNLQPSFNLCFALLLSRLQRVGINGCKPFCCWPSGRSHGANNRGSCPFFSPSHLDFSLCCTQEHQLSSWHKHRALWSMSPTISAGHTQTNDQETIPKQAAAPTIAYSPGVTQSAPGLHQFLKMIQSWWWYASCSTPIPTILPAMAPTAMLGIKRPEGIWNEM